MAASLSTAQLTALAELYESELTLRFEHPDLLDQALDLALSERRKDHPKQYFFRNVVRNARHSVWRRARSEIQAAAHRPLPDARHRRWTWRDGDGCDRAEIIDHSTPESAAMAADLLAHLDRFVSQLAGHGPRCLDRLLEHRSARETARNAGVSVTTVERCWRNIRGYVRENFYPDYP